MTDARLNRLRGVGLGRQPQQRWLVGLAEFLAHQQDAFVEIPLQHVLAVRTRGFDKRGLDVARLAELLDEITNELLVVLVTVDQLEGADVVVAEKDGQQARGIAVEGADLGGAEVVAEGRVLFAANPLVLTEYLLDVLACEARCRVRAR